MGTETTLIIQDDFDNIIKVFPNTSTHAFIEIQPTEGTTAFALLTEKQLLAIADKCSSLACNMLLERIKPHQKKQKA